jgi:hypothetical protein
LLSIQYYFLHLPLIPSVIAQEAADHQLERRIHVIRVTSSFRQAALPRASDIVGKLQSLQYGELQVIPDSAARSFFLTRTRKLHSHHQCRQRV